MFPSFLIITIIFALILCGQSFQANVGTARSVLKNFNMNEKNEVKQSGLFLYRAFIFPYQVYEIDSNGSNMKQAKTFVFVKIDYQILNQTLHEQPRAFYRINQYQFLYAKIPEIVLFQGEPNQYMELKHENPSIYNSQFIIANATNYKGTKVEGIIDLNFYSIQITKFFQLGILNAQKDMKSVLKEETVKSILKETTKFTQEGINSNQTERNQFIITYFFVNESSPVYFGQLFNTDMHRTIEQSTTWFSYNDGFSIYFASAILKKSGNETIIDLWIIIMKEGKQKRSQHIKQPVSYLNMTSVSFLKLCSSGDRLKLLLGDLNNVFVIDVTTHLWTVDLFKMGISFSDLIFDSSCKLLKVDNQFISEIYGITRVKFQQKIISVATLANFFVFCLESNTCKIYQKNVSKQISSIALNHSFTTLGCQQLISINNETIKHQILCRQKWSRPQFYKQVDFKENKTSKRGNISKFYSFIYPYEAYFNKTFLRSNQLDKTFFNYIENAQILQMYNIPQNYYDFSMALDRNCSSFDSGQTNQKITINSDSKWSVCSITVSTSSLLYLKIIPNNTQTKMYICETSLQNYAINPQTNCQAYTHVEQKSYYLPNNKLVKFYIVRAPRQNNFPTFYLRDIQKQQILYASTVFFYLMLVLSVSFFVVIIFIIIRPIMIAVMIYYGWRPDLTVPTYPLSWFQLKIKIKRLVQTKFLKYVPHQPTSEGEDNHCCFCLQNLMKGTTIAQLYCLHQFHKECFNEWIKNEPNLRCPTCRRQFTRQQLNDFRSSHNLI